MANINRVVLVGNLTRDPELRHTPSGMAVCSLRLAVNTRRKDAATGEWTEKPNYFDITVWGTQGENCAQYLSKGRPVGVDGRLEWREWEAQDGSKRQAVEVIADTVQFLGSRGDGGGGAAAVRPRLRDRAGATPISARPPTTTSRSRKDRMAQRTDRKTDKDRQGGRKRAQTGPDQAQVLLLLQGQGRGDRLQERQPAPPVHLREGQDPQPPHHRRLPAPPAPGRRRGQARARDGAPAIRHGRLMEVILLNDVDSLGLRGEVVNVARGYARNFLLPRRLAEPATPAKVAELRKRDEHRARHEARSVEQAQEMAAILEKTELRFEVKAGPTGSLFGSVTPTQIADELWRTRKVRVDRRKIGIDTIKRIGRYEVRSSSSRTCASR